MNVALEGRVSSTRQQQSQTMAQQLARLQDSGATQRDWPLAAEPLYRDGGDSGAQLNRPGRAGLRDRAACAALERVRITTPARLARNFTPQLRLIEALSQRGGAVACRDRRLSDEPHDRRWLHIRGAVAEDDRPVLADRRRRGRPAKLRSGPLLPWRRAPYGDILAPDRPRASNRVPLDPVHAAVVAQSVARYPDAQTPVSL